MRPALAVAIAALCLTACGSSSSTSSGASGSGGSSSTTASAANGHSGVDRSKFAACLKSHGVTLPQRPPGSGGYGGGTPPAGANGSGATHRGYFFGGGGAGRGQFANLKFRAAIRACGGGHFTAGRGGHFALHQAAVTKFVACVKQHSFTLPAPNFSGKGPIFPPSIEKNEGFQAAAKACASDLRPAGAPRPGGPPPGSSSSTTGD
ncbi:MAG: hypothetical protein WAL63_19460 [Solirubrobacteraceae bacterium]